MIPPYNSGLDLQLYIEKLNREATSTHREGPRSVKNVRVIDGHEYTVTRYHLDGCLQQPSAENSNWYLHAPIAQIVCPEFNLDFNLMYWNVARGFQRIDWLGAKPDVPGYLATAKQYSVSIGNDYMMYFAYFGKTMADVIENHEKRVIAQSKSKTASKTEIFRNSVMEIALDCWSTTNREDTGEWILP